MADMVLHADEDLGGTSLSQMIIKLLLICSYNLLFEGLHLHRRVHSFLVNWESFRVPVTRYFSDSLVLESLVSGFDQFQPLPWLNKPRTISRSHPEEALIATCSSSGKPAHSLNAAYDWASKFTTGSRSPE